MTGMNVSGMIMVQEAQRGGFAAHVYDSRLAAAIQLLRVEIRRNPTKKDCLESIAHIVAEVNQLLEEERAGLEEE